MTNTNNTKSVALHLTNTVDIRTAEVRLDDHRTARWLGNNQMWRFEGGDAIVVVGDYPECYAVVRVGDTVKVCDISTGGGICRALKGHFGIEAHAA
jgi:hypothetical protein